MMRNAARSPCSFLREEHYHGSTAQPVRRLAMNHRTPGGVLLGMHAKKAGLARWGTKQYFPWYNHSMRPLVSLLLLSTFPIAHAFPDIATHQFRGAIEHLEERGVVAGNPDGKFRPDRPINRAEFLKILMLASGTTDGLPWVRDNACFGDFTGERAWYWIYACGAVEKGIVHGYPDGTFRGERTVNFAEALKLTALAYGLQVSEPDSSRQSWYDPYVRLAAERGVFRVLPNDPGRELLRGEAAALLVAFGEQIEDLSGGEERTWEREEDGAWLDTVKPKPIPFCGNGILEHGEQCDDGNREIGDGCSDLCIVVPEPVRHGALRIEQRSLGAETAVSGARDVLLLQFDALAGRQDVYVTTLKFASAAGTLTAAGNYRLFADLDGDEVPETVVGTAAAQGETLAFAPLNVLVEDGRYRRMEVRGDMVMTENPLTIALGFAASEPDVVEAVDRRDGEDVAGVVLDDGDCALETICWVRLFTSSPRVISVTASGSVTVE